jgi:G3E family GTPase
MPGAIVVAGFLGAGKTTFIEQVLLPALAAQNRQPALIVNDAGAFNYDALRINGHTLPLWEVAGGCGCCGAQGALSDAVAEAVAHAVSPIVVECSGLAAPEPVVAVLQTHGLRRIAVLTLVAAPIGLARLNEHPDLARAQLGQADAVILSAPEAISATELDTLVQAVARQSRAPLWWFREGVLYPSDWLETLALVTRLPSDFPLAEPSESSAKSEPPRPQHGTLTVRSASLPGWYRREQIEAWLQGLPPGVLRLKGVAAVVGSYFPLAFETNGWTIAFHPLGQLATPQWFAVGYPKAIAEIVPPPPLDSADIPWDDELLWLPRGACDARPDVAWRRGEPIPPRQAAELWEVLCQGQTEPLQVTRREWQTAATSGWTAVCGNAPQTPPSPAMWLAALLMHHEHTHSSCPPLFCAADLPWPAVEAACQIAGWPLERVAHFGRYWSSPSAALSFIAPPPFFAPEE